jgi:hypothetical protein
LWLLKEYPGFVTKCVKTKKSCGVQCKTGDSGTSMSSPVFCLLGLSCLAAAALAAAPLRRCFLKGAARLHLFCLSVLPCRLIVEEVQQALLLVLLLGE